MKDRKKILLLDFDGVLHSYKSGWKGAKNIPDPPVPGALEFIVEAVRDFDVCIYSARSSQFGGIRAMRKWLKKQYYELGTCVYWNRQKKIDNSFFSFICERAFAGSWEDEVRCAIRRLFKRIRFPTKKPGAFLTIDDRCFLFKGQFPSMDEISNFKPWYGE